ncbi:hypothetical protein [Coraliomargarita parva]|uniref:hypothetical protein n=1 Tax=Coraliomargarita parva TaxID=3014050 RepID=UPI0022B31FE5|nr:hypothetical protein [Coraliomargarita parva]
MLRFCLSSLRWLFGWLYYVCLICFGGALLGVVTHLAFALLFQDSPDRGFYAAFGFMNGLKYGSVWAGGAAIVCCVIRARHEFLAREAGAQTEVES